MLVRDGEIGADLIPNGDHANGKAPGGQVALQPLAGIAAGDQYGQGLAAEGVDDARRVDATPTCGFAAGIDVRAVLKGQTIYIDDVIDGRIDGQCNDQETILTRSKKMPAGMRASPPGRAAPLSADGPSLGGAAERRLT